ncbi:MAG: hypothetical protein Q8873_06745 [Bacillota bacterium]|nr:hypothetical protein [Bacillota bacterium]
MTNSAYFFRDINNFDELNEKTKKALSDGSRRQKFKIIVEKTLSNDDFLEFQKSFIRTKEFIKLNTYKLTMNNDAEYLCILVKTEQIDYGILVNSAGYTYAKNVAIIWLGE